MYLRVVAVQHIMSAAAVRLIKCEFVGLMLKGRCDGCDFFCLLETTRFIRNG